MATAIGIDFGNTSTCIAVCKNGKSNVAANSHGDRLTPAMVTFLEEETLIGFASKQASRRHLQETVKHVKALLGKRYNDKLVQELVRNAGELGMKIGEDTRGSPVYSVEGCITRRNYSSEDIAKLILKDVLVTAQTQAGNDVNEAVFTAPVGYLATYRDTLLEVASSVGFEVLRIVSEPAAAALAYGVGIDSPESGPYDVVVFRVGGITQDVSLLEVCNGMVTVKNHIAERNGGDVLTDDIAAHFASVFEREFKTPITKNAKAMNKLRVQAEICKHVLSAMPSATCHIDSLYDGMDFNGNMSRSRFEMLVGDHLQTLVQPLKNLLLEPFTGTEKIKKVIMCGGTSSIPRLQALVSSVLPNAELLCSIPPSEVIGLGAAMEAGLLVNSNVVDIADEDCEVALSPVNIYIKIFEKTVLAIEEKKPLPCSVEEEFILSPDKSDFEVLLCVGQKDELSVLAQLDLNNLSLGSSVNIQLKYLMNGHLILLCRDIATSVSKSLTVTC